MEERKAEGRMKGIEGRGKLVIGAGRLVGGRGKRGKVDETGEWYKTGGGGRGAI
jgi:hypothetical protein